MSAPLVTPDDFGTYLDLENINVERAAFILARAQTLCESIVSPLPAGAEAVVLDVATRAWSNPTNAQQESTGPYGASFGAVSGGLWLTRQNKATLRRLNGSSSAFSIDPLPAGTNCVQTLTVSATAGEYVLNFNGQDAASLAFDAVASDIHPALAALSSIGTGNVIVTGSGPFAITFVNDLGATVVPGITVDTSSLTGTASVAMTVPGLNPPGSVAIWDRDNPSWPVW